MSFLVIVESPAKAKTISRYLDQRYVVEASYGHLRDLPATADEIPARLKKQAWARLGVDVDNDFRPLYIVPDDKKKYVKRLKSALADADKLLLATDEDREGESISWHAVEVLKPTVPVERIAFHEITSEAIEKAIGSPRKIDDSLVKAQESRRILDRLFGYLLSPLLWKKVRRGLSAGRVQSVAVRLAVMRERERRAFRNAGYFGASAELESGQQRFSARLVRLDGRRLATGQDFDASNGELKAGSQALWLSSQSQAQQAIDGLDRPWKVVRAEKKPFSRRPAPPFTTSSLQQEANRKLRFSTDRTMRVAQRLYEGIDIGSERVGLITYMRTDSLTLANRALVQSQEVISQLYGPEFAPGPRRYRTKTLGAQEAHEAIRPTDLTRTPKEVSKYLNRDEQRIYELIWRRTIASQMADARLMRTAVEIEATAKPGQPGAVDGIFAVNGRTIVFPGFLRVYVEGSDDPAAELADKELILPELEEGQLLQPISVEVTSHETSPPARFTEASLVKRLEAEGIGRPSTYASIVATIQDRGYIVKESNALVPTFTAFAVTQLLEKHFADYTDLRFTARMEDELDEIAAGRVDARSQLRRIYFGNEQPGLKDRVSREEETGIEYPQVEIGIDDESGQRIVVKIGRYGPYIQMGEGEQRVIASLPDGIAPADFDVPEAVAILRKKQQGMRELGIDPASGHPVFVATGRYGVWVQLGETPEDKKAAKPKRSSLPKNVQEEEVSLDLALKWLSLPRTLGEDPSSGDQVLATMGRYGPHIRCGEQTRSLDSEESIFTITLSQALTKLKEPKGRRRRGGEKKVLKEFGPDPDSGSPVQLLDGPYGPYLTNAALNASLPKGADPAALKLQDVLEILAEKGKAPKRRGAKASSRRSEATKKTA